MNHRRRDRGWKQARKRLALRWRALTGSQLEPRKWVFVIGCYNSGTTLLANLLEAHPEINGLPREGVELTDVLARPENFRWPRMWNRCQDQVSLTASEATAAFAARIKAQWSHHVQDGGLIVEKSIANLLHVEFLAAHFQPAYFIHIRRNGYAAAEGIYRRAKPEDWGRTEFGEHYPMTLCAEQWRASLELFDAQKEDLPHLLEVTYEKLTSAPEKTLAQVSQFLDIASFDAEITTREWSIHRVNSSIRDMNADSINRLSNEQIKEIDAVAEALLVRHGYQRP